jgi:hypothetical protein
MYSTSGRKSSTHELKINHELHQLHELHELDEWWGINNEILDISYKFIKVSGLS